MFSSLKKTNEFDAYIMATWYLTCCAIPCILVSIIVFPWLIHGLYIGEAGKKIKSQWFKFPSVLASFFYLATSILLLLTSFTTEIEPHKEVTNVSSYFMTITLLLILCLILAKLSIYISILSRLYLTFKESAYNVRKSILRIMIFILFLFLGSGLYWIWLLYLKYALKHTPSSYYNQFDVVSITLFFCDFMSSVVMLLLFIRKLCRVILERRQSNIQSVAEQYTLSINKELAELDDREMKFIDMITRYTLLSIWQISTAQCGLVSLIMAGFYLHWHQHFGEDVGVSAWDKMHYYFFTLLSMDILVNSVTLILYFEFCRSVYWKMCGRMDGCCKGCFVRYTDRMIRRQFNKSLADIHRRKTDYMPLGGN